MTWNESRRFCQLKSADLIIINNLQEQVISDTIMLQLQILNMG